MRGPQPSQAVAERGGEEENRGQQREPGSDKEGRGEALVDAVDQHLVGTLGEGVVGVELVVVDVAARVGEDAAHATPWILGLDGLREPGSDLELDLRVDLGVEDDRRSPLLRLLERGVDLALGDRGEDQQRKRDPGVTHRKQQGGVAPVALGQDAA